MTEKSIDRRLDDLNDHVTRLQNYVQQMVEAFNQNGQSLQEIAKKFNRNATYFDLLVGILGHNGTIDEDQFAAAQKALDREVMNQQLKHNITEEEDGQ